uniref:Uncharacterized protein n=1 Tax=Glossina brevipalpis TaxID=37001 RepID=A0A1A9W4I6_9MUSC
MTTSLMLYYAKGQKLNDLLTIGSYDEWAAGNFSATQSKDKFLFTFTTNDPNIVLKKASFYQSICRLYDGHSEDGMKEEETNYVNELMFLSVFINCSFRPSYILMLFRQTPELHFDFDRFMLSFAFVNAGVIHPAPVVAVGNVEEYDPHPQYTYGYDVKDALSGDSKTAVESRDGHVVRGQYSLNDADGYRRIVDYTADPVNGFNAIVRREPLVAAIPAAPVVAPHAHVAVAPVAVVPVPKAVAPLIASPAFVKTTFASPHITYQNPSYRNVKWNKV